MIFTLPNVTNYHLLRPAPPLERDVLYGRSPIDFAYDKATEDKLVLETSFLRAL